MKKLFSIILFLSFSLLFAKEALPYRVSVQNFSQEAVKKEIKLDKYNRQLGYQIINNGESVVFLFVPSVWKIEKPLSVFVEGSFNGWSKKNPDWELTKVKNQLWTLECPAEKIKIPGNSGFPEFKFIVQAQIDYTESVCGQEVQKSKKETFEPNAVSRIVGYQMASNNLILFPQDNPEDVIQNLSLMKAPKKLKDYNLEEAEDRERIANFRLVPGTSSLYRGYHPYKISRGNLDTEKPRLACVNQLLKEKGVQSIITLSGNEQIDPKKETISVYVSDIRTKGNHFFVNTHYNIVYYQSAGQEFGNMIGDIVRFINDHPAPFYVHCRLGTDRTGVISAVLASLCGASWQEIREDYQKTNLLGIQEVRDWRLLKYSFDQILGKPVEEVTDLQKELSTFFIENKFFSSAELDSLQKKLKA